MAPHNNRFTNPYVPMLRISARAKRFGDIVAVDNLDLEVHTGEVLGFLGPNGSGKSTTVGMLLGLIHPTAGQVELFGDDVRDHPEHVRRRVGAIIEAPAFYPYLSGRDNLRALALAAGGVPSSRIEELLELVGLREWSHSPYKTYSLGMKQRLGIASTLLTDPDLVIFDEPTNGLDPAGQRNIRALISTLARQGRAVLLVSHLLYGVEQVSDRVAIIRKGKLLREGTVADMVRGASYLDVEIADPAGAADVLRPLPFVTGVTVNGRRLQVEAPAEQAPDVARALADNGFYPAELARRHSTLEDVFLDLTELAVEPAVLLERKESDGRHAA